MDLKAKNRGFALIELLVVLSILAILSTVGISIYSNAVKRVNEVKIKSDLDAISKTYETGYIIESNSYSQLDPSNFPGNKIPAPPNNPNGSYIVTGPETGFDQGFAICGDTSTGLICNNPQTNTNCLCKTSTKGETSLAALLQPPPLTAQTPSTASINALKQAKRIIVKYKSGVTSAEKTAVRTDEQVTLKKEIVALNSEVGQATNDVADTVNQLQLNPEVQYAEEDHVVSVTVSPNDVYFNNQWNLAKINAPDAWGKTRGSSSITVAILDTGVDDTHPDLAGRVIKSANFTGDGSGDLNGHGTHVAGIAAAVTDNSQGVASVSFGSPKLLSVKVLGNNGYGYYSWIAEGIIWAADNGANIINMSLAGYQPSQLLQDAIDYAWNKGVVVVAAAGNHGSSTPVYPAYNNNVLSVAATDENDSKASFSGYGSWVDLAAPGVSIISTYKGGYAYLSGTSMATPLVAGLAALVKSESLNLSNQEITNKLNSTADKISGTGSFWTYGRINACKAVDCQPSANPTPSSAPTPSSTPGSTGKPVITYPNGGETFNTWDYPVRITWDSNGGTGICNLYFTDSGLTAYYNIDAVDINLGSYIWTAFTPLGSTSPQQEKISIVCSSGLDESDSYFTVTGTTAPLGRNNHWGWPTAPQNLITTQVTNNAVNLQWDLSSSGVGVVKYYIYRDKQRIGSTTNSYSYYYSDTNLQPNIAYSYYVQAEDYYGNVGGFSPILSVTTSP